MPKRVATERLGVLERRRYQVPPELDLAGQVLAVVRLEVVEGPFDDDPAEFAEQILQAGLEAVAGLGRGVGPAERDDEATEFGDHRDQAGGQREQGGGEVRCQQESGARSMVHRGGLSCCGDRACQTLSLHRRGPSTFKRFAEVADSSRVTGENPGNGLKLVAPARLHPASGGHLDIDIGGTSPGPGGYSQLNMSGAASLDGFLDLSVVDGFHPVLGDIFVILTSNDLSGMFSNETGLVDGDMVFRVEYSPPGFLNDVVLEAAAVPEPSSLIEAVTALLVLGGLSGWNRRRGRRRAGP